MFAVQRIEVTGARPSVVQRVDAALAPLDGTSLLALNAADLDERLSPLRDVSLVSYDRAFPHTAKIVVSAERPVAVLQARLAGVDRHRARPRARAGRRSASVEPAAHLGCERTRSERGRAADRGRGAPSCAPARRRALGRLRSLPSRPRSAVRRRRPRRSCSGRGPRSGSETRTTSPCSSPSRSVCSKRQVPACSTSTSASRNGRSFADLKSQVEG